MKPTLVATGFALALMTGLGAAYAADTNAATTAKTPEYAAPVIADADAMKAADQLHHTSLRQQLQDQLTKAGYTQVKIMPSSFYVQAKDKKGEPVAMVIGPDSFAAVTDLTATPPAAAAQQTPDKTVQQK